MDPFINQSCLFNLSDENESDFPAHFTISAAAVTIFLQIILVLKAFLISYFQSKINQKTEKGNQKMKKIKQLLRTFTPSSSDGAQSGRPLLPSCDLQRAGDSFNPNNYETTHENEPMKK